MTKLLRSHERNRVHRFEMLHGELGLGILLRLVVSIVDDLIDTLE